MLISWLSPSTPQVGHLPVWPKPGNEPLEDVDRAVLVAVHHQAAVLVLAAIRPFPQRHVLLVFARMTHPGGIALINYREFFVHLSRFERILSSCLLYQR